MIFAADNDTVARPNELITGCWRDLMLVDDLDGGVDRMRWRALHCNEQWLPKETLEEAKEYAKRVKRSHLYPGFTQGLDDAIARPFAKPVHVENLPTELELMVEDIDGDGNDLTQFSAHLMRAAVKHGMAHAWVDFTQAQPANGKTTTKADEAKTAPRAWWSIIERPRVLGWKEKTLPNGKRALSEFRFHEIATVPDGVFGEKKVERIRILRLNSYELWQNKAYNPPRYNDFANLEARFYDFKENRPQDWEQVVPPTTYGPEGGFEELPIVTLYTGYQGFMRAKPPFIALAETNVTHWQSSSDQRNILHFARVPMMFFRGFSAEEVKGQAVGAGSAFGSQNPGANVSIVEHSGAAVAAGSDDLANLELEMQQLGVRPSAERMQNATATGIAINADGADTDVQAWAQATDTAIEQCFNWTARWMGKPELTADLDVQIFKDYQVAYKGASDVPALQTDVEKGRIRVETYLKEIKRRGLLGDDVDVEEEVAAAETAKAERQAIADKISGGMNPNDPNANQPGGKPDEDGEEEDPGNGKTNNPGDESGKQPPPNPAGS